MDGNEIELNCPEIRKRTPNSYSFVYKNNTKTNQNVYKNNTKTNQNEQKKEQTEILFECNICLDTASNPVVTLCGHLFCWPCINSWLKQPKPNSQTCPVCKSGINKSTLVPIYAKGRTEDPRNQPDETRPSGKRTEPDRYENGIFNGQFGIGFGFFPFIPFFHFGERIDTEQGNSLVSRMFLMIATLVLVSIILY